MTADMKYGGYGAIPGDRSGGERIARQASLTPRYLLEDVVFCGG